MFETAELGRKVSKEDFRERLPELREELLDLQGRLRSADFPVIVLFGGVDGAGKSETANLLSSWMDPRRLVTRAFGQPSQEESERPPMWRYWRDLPARGHIALFLSAWYSEPLLDHVYGKTSGAEYGQRLERIASFERMLAADGALVLKFWMHLGKKAQRRRFKSLERDPLQRWRVTDLDWKHWKMYDRFVASAERLILGTDTGDAPWTIVEGEDERYRSLKVATLLASGIRHHLERERPAAPASPLPIRSALQRRNILSSLDMSRALGKSDYKRERERLQGRLNLLRRKARERRMSTIVVLEGWDAAGKGGTIRRITPALDARNYQVIPIAAPTDEERAHHYLWRFWRHLPRAGRVTFFDRSWYGRVLVERIESFASKDEWRRAYAEINEFESDLVRHGIVLVKYWIHITREEQEKRFSAREQTPYKRWKLGPEDWRNREKWQAYEDAAHEMIERTSTAIAPWVLVEGNDKRYARVRALRVLCERLDEALEADGRSEGKRARRGS